MWRSEPGCTEASRQRRGRPGPGQRQPERLCLGPSLLRVLQAPNLSHHDDHVIGGVLSLSVRHSQPDIRCFESSCRPDDDLIVSGVVKTKIELGPSPGYHKEVSKQRVGDRSDGADGDKDRRPSVDSGAEDWAKMIQQRQDVRSISFGPHLPPHSRLGPGRGAAPVGSSRRGFGVTRALGQLL
jgi:hypothetical protein